MQQHQVYIRKWLGQQKNNTFRLMSYNILANSLLQEEECNMPSFQWQNRWPLILKQINQYKPDILCLQEFDQNEQELSLKLQQNQYEKQYLKRSGELQQDGCAIFYQKNKYELLNIYNVLLKQEHLRVNEQQVMDKPNVCLIIVLKQQNNPNPIIIANSHLIFNKNRGDLKLCQMQLIMLALQQLQQKYQKSKIIWCGDFNLSPNSALYTYILNGKLQFNHLNPRYISGQSSLNYRPTDYLQDRLKVQQRCGQFQGKYEYIEQEQFYDIYTQALRCQLQDNKLMFNQVDFNMDSLLETPIKFQSVYSSKQKQMINNLDDYYQKWQTYEPLITTMSQSQVGCVDYIWIDQLQIAQILQLPRIQDLIQNPLINSIDGSDHLPLVCDLY